MREIKFRAYRKFDSKMYNVFSFCKDFIKIDTTAGVIKYLIDDFSPLMQFTGLTDKNGTEIYEGDIVEHGVIKQKSTIVFIDGSFAISNEKSRHNTCLRHYASSEIEVIVNIHEHIELLK